MQEKNNLLKAPVRYFKGVGPKRSEQFLRLGIETAEDLLYYLPVRYEDRSNFTRIKDLKAGFEQTVQGRVITLGARIAKSGIAIFQMAVGDDTGFIHAVWFNQPYLKDYFRKGQTVVLYGRVERHEKLQITQPEYEILKGDETDSVHIGRIVPIYRLTANMTERYLRGLMYQAVSKYRNSFTDKLPAYILAREKVVDIRFAINNIHFPSSFANLEKAYRRIVFEEFLTLQLALALKKKDARSPKRGLNHAVTGDLIDSFKKALPFELTEAQKKAMGDIERDMSQARPMNRLLEGDVGSGKTVVAAEALAITVQNGFQAVLMAPTEILARQHFIVLSELLMPLGINVALLVGGIEAKARDRLYSDIKAGKINVIVGTHAIIQESVEFKKLGLAVIDEQHKFGVTQRSVLRQKGYSPHILVMTATPIPRTLALTVYGDLDISVIKELPKGRRPIATYWVEEERRKKVYDFVKEELDKGRQAYVVCPLIEKPKPPPGSDYLSPSHPGGAQAKGDYLDPSHPGGARRSQGRDEAQGAVEMYEKLKDEVFQGCEVGLLHGRMDSSQKEAVMKDFKKGRIKVLVSTIVIEVGIDIPNATVMIIENAERFGLAQLHQLRGRIGRGAHESYCILLANPRTEEARQRLKAIEDTLDGFQIAEADLNIRGPGEFFGTRQHGALPEIRFGNIIKDFDIMELARIEAFDLVAKDPGLAEERHRLLRQDLVTRFKGKFDLINVG